MWFLMLRTYHLATDIRSFFVPFQNCMATSGAWAMVKPTNRPMYPPVKISHEVDKMIFEMHASLFQVAIL